jgi:acetate kinase
VVHGGRTFFEPTLIDDYVISEIERISSLAPLHNPANLTGIQAARDKLPDVPSVAVFDTAFFHALPEAAATYAIDRGVAKLHAIRRYGFHGTSHQFVSEQVPDLLGKEPSDVNQIVLHLGNGASASAIRGGDPIDTSMGMTPLEGLVMGTRSGDIDPGVVLHLHRVVKLNADQINTLLNKNSGLKGLCGDNDFRSVTKRIADGDPAAKLAYDVYIHRLRRYIGAYMIDLGRVDAITFTAGVGENAASVRADALAGLENYGIVVDPERNVVRSRQPRRISTDDSPVAVLVVPTNEELAIARQSAEVVEG